MHGVGSQTARRLYDLGLRNVNDLRNYYGVDVNDESDEIESQSLDDVPNDKQNEKGIKYALRVYDEVNTLYALSDVLTFFALVINADEISQNTAS